MLKKLADSDGVSMSDVVRMLIRRAYRTRFERRTVDSDRDVKPEITPIQDGSANVEPRRHVGASTQARAYLTDILKNAIANGHADALSDVETDPFEHDQDLVPEPAATLTSKFFKLDPSKPLTYSKAVAALAAWQKQNNPNKK